MGLLAGYPRNKVTADAVLSERAEPSRMARRVSGLADDLDGDAGGVSYALGGVGGVCGNTLSFKGCDQSYRQPQIYAGSQAGRPVTSQKPKP